MLLQVNKNKKGISVMIGYVLLISLAVVMGIIVYASLKTYVPKDVAECPDSVSLVVKNIECVEDANGNPEALEVTLQNRGYFNVNYYYARATLEPSAEIATYNLFESRGDGGLGDFPQSGDYSKPGDEDNIEFLFDPVVCSKDSSCTATNKEYTIYSLEITPIILQENENGGTELISCGNVKVKEKILPSGCLLNDAYKRSKGGLPTGGTSGPCSGNSGAIDRFLTETEGGKDVCISGDIYGFYKEYIDFEGSCYEKNSLKEKPEGIGAC